MIAWERILFRKENRKMKLLFIMQTIRARGAERVASVLTSQLTSMGHKVYLICIGFVRGEEYAVDDRVHIEFIPESSGSRLHLMLVRIRFIREKIAVIRPDCIISLADARTIFMITAAHRGASIPMIFSERHDPVHNPKSKADRFMRWIAYHACDCVVFQTKGAKSFFSPAISRKGTIIENPIMEDLPSAHRGERKPYVATFCRLVPQKNLSLLLRAFRRIAIDDPKLRLVIYGDGDLKQTLEEEAEQLGIAMQTDFRPHSLNVHAMVSDCAMFVSSSDYEGQSNSMLEAMAMGLPCVCTDCPCGGARAVIKNGVNGLLIPVGDEEKLAEAMRYMLDHPEEARRMGDNAAKIRNERKPNIIAGKWDRLIREVAERE